MSGKNIKTPFYWYLIGATFLIFLVNVITSLFPFRAADSAVILLFTITVFLIYQYRLIPGSPVKKTMIGIAGSFIFFALLRVLKYSVFHYVAAIPRYLWYAYYIPLLSISFLFFMTAWYTFAPSAKRGKIPCIVAAGVTVLLILLVLTNDLHQVAFRFRPGFENWDSDYTVGIGLYVVLAWEMALYVSAIAVLYRKCSLEKSRRSAWIISIPIAIGAIFLLLIFTDNMIKIGTKYIAEFPETNIITVAGILECCMSLGLIPTNESYRNVLSETKITTQITDDNGRVFFRSENSPELTKEQFAAGDLSHPDENTVLRKMKIHGGYGLWLEDITELNRLNASLTEMNERLAEEGELYRLQNELSEKRAKIEQRSRLYDAIAEETQHQSLAISVLSEKGVETQDEKEKEKIKRTVTLYGAYLKRYANLKLLGEKDGTISSEELGLSIAETLHYLNYYGIPGDLYQTARCRIRGELAIAAYQTLEELLETGLPHMIGMYVMLCEAENGLLLKVTAEGVDLSAADTPLCRLGVTFRQENEDETTYLAFLLPKKEVQA